MEVKELYKGELNELIQSGAILVDVREDDDLATPPGIPGGRHVPLSRIGELDRHVPRSAPLIFFCRSGLLSYRAAEIASTWTREAVYYLAGGLLDTDAMDA